MNNMISFQQAFILKYTQSLRCESSRNTPFPDFIYHLPLINDSNTSILNLFFNFLHTTSLKSCNLCSVPVYHWFIARRVMAILGWTVLSQSTYSITFSYLPICSACTYEQGCAMSQWIHTLSSVSLKSIINVCKMPLITAIARLSATTLSSRARAKLLNKFWSSVNGF